MRLRGPHECPRARGELLHQQRALAQAPTPRAVELGVLAGLRVTCRSPKQPPHARAWLTAPVARARGQERARPPQPARG